MFPNCSREPIRKSHTIPRASLAMIAETGHVLQPRSDHKQRQLRLRPVGINQASAFSGFCLSHETVFQDFELHGRIQRDSDYLLQVMRTVCRELAIKERLIRRATRDLKTIVRRRKQWGRIRIMQELSKHYSGVNLRNVRNVTIKTSDFEKQLRRELTSWRRDLQEFGQTYYDAFAEAFETFKLNIVCYQYSLPYRLPVALAGRGNFVLRYAKSGKVEEVQPIINVLPTANGSESFIAVPKKHERALQFYLNGFLGDGAVESGVLTMIESWMLNGTDHWFLAPSAWEALSESQRLTALNAIESTKLNISDAPGIGILDSVRLRKGVSSIN